MELIHNSLTTKSKKQFYSTPNPYEHQIGYYRAVRHGSSIFVSGTTAVALDHQSPLQTHTATGPQIQYPGDAKRQTIVALKECLKAIEALTFAHRYSSAENDQAPSSLSAAASIVRVRMFVANQKDCVAVGEGFREVLGKGNGSEYGYEGIGAAATMIVVPGGFVHDEMLVEIEVDAIVEED